MERYQAFCQLTSQYRFCPNSLRIDMYKGCDFGCSYCFANGSLLSGSGDKRVVDFNEVEHLFYTALETDKDTKKITTDLIRHRVPLHCGGSSDPFQSREKEYKLTYKLIELSVKYNYPILFSTKTNCLSEEYFEILNPSIHAFQISLIGLDTDYIRKYESSTPTAYSRCEFIKRLRQNNFWCGVRLQPVIDLQQVLKLINYLNTTPSYYTVEHLKLPQQNISVKTQFTDEFNDLTFVKSKNNIRNIEIDLGTKIANIQAIIKLANSYGIKVGVGDNDLHHLSQSRCCCGLDLINENFSNYLKYNLIYLITGNVDSNDLWMPTKKFQQRFISYGTDKRTYKECVDDYILTNKTLVPKSYQAQVTKFTGINFTKKLF